MRLTNGTTRKLAVAFGLLLSCSLAQADTSLYTVGMPSGDGVNDLSAPLNVALATPDSSTGWEMLGDQFIASSNWHVNEFDVWVIGTQSFADALRETTDRTDPGGFAPTSGPSLYLMRPGEDTFTAVSDPASFTFVRDFYSSDDLAPTRANYYASQIPGYFSIWKLAFTNLDLTLLSGEYYFGLYTNTQDLIVHTTSCSENPGIECGTYELTRDGYGDFAVDPARPIGVDPDTGDTLYQPWDTNVNLDIIGYAVPEPASFALMGAGLGLIGLAVRRRRK